MAEVKSTQTTAIAAGYKVLPSADGGRKRLFAQKSANPNRIDRIVQRLEYVDAKRRQRKRKQCFGHRSYGQVALMGGRIHAVCAAPETGSTQAGICPLLIPIWPVRLSIVRLRRPSRHDPRAPFQQLLVWPFRQTPH